MNDQYPKKGYDTLMSSLKNLIKNGGSIDGWKQPNDYHVTCLFIGGDESKKESDIYKNFKEGTSIPIEIKAVLFVPDRILTGICFPKYEIDNEFPHMTLMVKKWPPVNSNKVLEATCKQG